MPNPRIAARNAGASHPRHRSSAACSADAASTWQGSTRPCHWRRYGCDLDWRVGCETPRPSGPAPRCLLSVRLRISPYEGEGGFPDQSDAARHSFRLARCHYRLGLVSSRWRRRPWHSFPERPLAADERLVRALLRAGCLPADWSYLAKLSAAQGYRMATVRCSRTPGGPGSDCAQHLASATPALELSRISLKSHTGSAPFAAVQVIAPG